MRLGILVAYSVYGILCVDNWMDDWEGEEELICRLISFKWKSNDKFVKCLKSNDFCKKKFNIQSIFKVSII